MARIIVQSDSGQITGTFVDDSDDDAPIGDLANDPRAARELAKEIALSVDAARGLDVQALPDDTALLVDAGTDDECATTWGAFRESNAEAFDVSEFASIARAIARTGRYDEPAGASASWSLSRVEGKG